MVHGAKVFFIRLKGNKWVNWAIIGQIKSQKSFGKDYHKRRQLKTKRRVIENFA